MPTSSVPAMLLKQCFTVSGLRKTGLVADPKAKAIALRLIKAYCVVFLQYHLRDDKDCLAQSCTQYTRRVSLGPTGRVIYYLYFIFVN